MLKKSLLVVASVAVMGIASIASAEHVHVFPSIDKPDKDMIIIKDYFVEDLREQNKFIFTDGTIGYRLYFAGPGAWTDTNASPHIYFYVPGQNTGKSRIMRLESKAGMFNKTRAFKLSEYTPEEDKQVPMFLDVLDRCFQETFKNERK